MSILFEDSVSPSEDHVRDATMARYALLLVCALLMLSPATAMMTACAAPADMAPYSPTATTTIYTVGELQNMTMGGDYALGNDIDASETRYWNAGAGFLPVSNCSVSFVGFFNGTGHSIKNLNINRPTTDCVGLFGHINVGAWVVNLNMVGANITGRDLVGIIAGHSGGSSSVNVINCSTNGTVTGHDAVAGLIGSTYQTSVTRSSSDAYITASGNNVAGLIGDSAYTTITKSYSAGTVETSGSWAGGLVGVTNYDTISNSFSTGNVTGSWHVGGFAGNSPTGSTSITNAFSSGHVTGTMNVGGFLGDGTLTATGCFWDNQTSGWTTSAGGIGKNTTDMMNKTMFVSAVWDFTNPWNIKENFTYPYLMGVPPFLSVSLVGGVPPATEDALFTVNFAEHGAKAPPQNSIIFKAMFGNCTTWCTFNTVALNISGTPTNAHVGTYWANLSVMDLVGNNASITINITVVNVPVKFTNSPFGSAPLAMDEDALFYFNFASTDEGQGPTYYNMSTGPGWLTMNPITGALSGTPRNADVGIHPIVVDVYDGWGGHDLLSSNIVVNDTNDPPAMLTSSLPSATQDQAYIATLAATDEDPVQQTLTWALVTNANWLSLNTTSGVLWGAPKEADVGSWWVNVTVSDGRGGNTSRNMTLTVLNANDLPKITTDELPEASEGTEYNFTLHASDPDIADTLTWSISKGPSWLSLNATTGILSGTPGRDRVGLSWVSVSVTDAAGAYDNASFLLTVSNVNEAPIIQVMPEDQELAEGQTLLFDIQAMDPDGDALRFSISSVPASGITIGQTSGTVSWINATKGNYTVTITVTDGLENTTATIMVLVNEAPVTPPPVDDNHPPFIGIVSPVTIEMGDTAVVDLTQFITDLDGDVLELTNITADPALLITKVGTVLVITVVDHVSTNSVTVSFAITDGEFMTYGDFTVNIPPETVVQKQAPVLSAPGADRKENRDGTADVEFSVTVKDTDSDSVEVSVVIDGKSYQMERTSGELSSGAVYSITVKDLKSGEHRYKFEADDGEGTTTSQASTNPTSLKVSEKTDWMPLLILVLVLFIMGAVLFVVGPRNKEPHPVKGKKEEEEEEDEEEEEEDEEEEDEEEEEDDEEEKEEEEDDEEEGDEKEEEDEEEGEEEEEDEEEKKDKK